MNWFKLLRSTSSVKKPTRAGNRSHRAQLGLEMLEDRLTPSANNVLVGSAMAMPVLQTSTTQTASVAVPAPTVLGPIGNINTSLPNLTWSTSNGAASYQLRLAPTGQNPIINLTGLTTTSYTPLHALVPGSYTMSVQAFNSAGQASAWSASTTFSVAPDAPTLLGPIGNINTHLPTFTWTAPTAAASYQLWVELTGQTSPLINVTNLTTTSYTGTLSLAPGSYTTWVRDFSSTGQASLWSASTTFSVAPDAPTLLGPIGNINTHLPTFTWTAPTAAASYQLWVELTGQTSPLINVTNLTTTSYTGTLSLAPGSYTMWVRDFSSTGQPSLWSASTTFSVAPDAPMLLGPIGNINTQLPTFTWTAPTAAASYQLWVELTGQTSPLINMTNLTTTSYTATLSLAPGSYTTWVRDFSSTGQPSLWSASTTFSVAPAVPATPTVLGPTGTINTPSPTFTWTATAGAATYALQVLNSQNNLVINVMNLTSTSYTPTQPLAAGAYTMNVRALGSAGQSSLWSTTNAFSVAPAVPATPTVLGPIGTINTPSPTFTWTATAGAATYALQVLNSQSNVVINVMNLTATSYTPTQPLAPGTYTMNVRALNSAGQSGSWSVPQSFTVAAPAPVVDLGQEVVAFAKSKLGTTVGGGECTDLVSAALQAAGAKTTDDFGVTGLNANYVWGTLVGTYQPGGSQAVFDLIKPGDIIQYSGVHITSGFSTFTIPHHSAIVEANLGGGKVELLEQNVNGERWVHETASQDLSGIDQGEIWIYQPVAK